MAKKAIVKKASNTLALSEDRPDWADGDKGNEEVTFDDLTIPRLDVIQDLSPQHKKNKPEYIEGAEPGLLFNTVTQELYDSSVMFIPVYFRKEFIIWRDIKQGGGFRGAHPSQQEAVNALGELEDADQCEIVECAQHFGLVVIGDRVEEVVISMSKSKLKTSRQLNSMVKIRGGDRFASAYEVRAVEAQNAAGQDYWNLGVKPLGFVSAELHARGEALYDQVKLGQKDVQREEASKEGDREY